MPTNLHAIIRYRTIDKCLCRPHLNWSREKLAEECGKVLREKISSDIDNPSIRTIQYDIDNMKSGRLDYVAPIVYDKKKKSYRYTDPTFTIRHSPLNNEDKNELHYALTILQQFKGFKYSQDLERVIAKLEFSKTLRDKPQKKVIEFEEIINPDSEPWLNDISEYIEKEICLSITYQPFGQESFEVVFSPYLLKEYNNRWFLFGWNHKEEKLRNYPLDRIKSLDKMGLEVFIDNHIGLLYDTLNQMVGVSFPDDPKVENVQFIASNRQANYIKTKPIHPSQKLIESNEDGTLFSLDLIINFELKSQLLSFGKNVMVVKPLTLRQEMMSHVAEMQRQYRS